MVLYYKMTMTNDNCIILVPEAKQKCSNGSVLFNYVLCTIYNLLKMYHKKGFYLYLHC